MNKNVTSKLLSVTPEYLSKHWLVASSVIIKKAKVLSFIIAIDTHIRLHDNCYANVTKSNI